MTQITQSELAILVVSCDRYHDVWDVFFQLFFRAWPNCKHRVYLGVNERAYRFDTTDIITVIRAGPDESWIDNLREMLLRIPEQFVLVFLDDFLVVNSVNESLIEQALDFVKTEKASCFRLVPRPPGSLLYRSYPQVQEIRPQDEYCVSTQVAIWNKATLSSLLQGTGSAWDFELRTSKEARSKAALPGLFLSYKQPVFSLKNGIIRGKWVRSSLRACAMLGVRVNTAYRPIQTVKEAVIEYLKMDVGHQLPAPIRRFLKCICLAVGGANLFVSKEV